MSWSQAMGIAATLIIAVALALGYSLQRRNDRTTLATGSEPDTGASAMVLSALDHGDAGFQQVRTELLRIIDLKGSALPPETRAIFMESLISIDRSINDIKLALGRSPDDPQLTRMLVTTRRQEIKLLKRAAELSQDI